MKTMVKFSIALVVVLLVIFLSYKEMLHHEFINWDTRTYVVENDHIKSLTWKNLQWMLTTAHLGNWHPLTWLSHAIDYTLFGLKPEGHHLTNLIIHSLNTILVGLLVFVLIAWQQGQLWIKHENNRTLLAATIAMLFFGIHPQNVESVVWIAERKNLLSQFFLLLGFLCYGFYVHGRSIKVRYYGYLSTFGCFILALMSKPIAVVFPIILMLLDVYPLHRTPLTVTAEKVKSNAHFLLFLEKIPFLILSVFVGIVTIIAQHSSGYMAGTQQLSITIRLLNAANSTLFYLSKFLFPIGLSPFYPLSNLLKDYQHYSNWVPVIGFFLITFVVSYLWYRKRYEGLIAWLFYLVALLPVIGLIQVGSQAAADRYAYLAMLPAHLLTAIVIATLFYSASKFKRSIQTLMILLIFSLSILLVNLTKQQVSIWQNDIKLWSYIVLINPDNVVGQIYLGSAYSEAGYHEKALAHYRLVEPLAPYRLIYRRLASVYVELGKITEALEICQRALTQTQEQIPHDEIYTVMGWIYLRQGDLPQAQVLLEKALIINPEQNLAKDLLVDMNELQKNKK